MKSLLFIFIAFLAVMLSQCSKTSSSSGVSGVLTNLSIILSNYTPDSLSYSSARLQSEGPCEGYNLFSCQPVLLRLYIDMQKMILTMAKEIVNHTQQKIDSVPDGSEETGVTVPNGMTLDYKKTTSSKFSILLKKDSTPVLYLDVDGNNYTIKTNVNVMSEGQRPGMLEASIVYESETSWTAAVLLANMGCDYSDVQRPDVMKIIMTRNADLWKGKAMMYNPRWLVVNPTCETEITDDIAMNFYTDFVADSAAAKANVYMMKRTVTSVDSITNYGFNALCTNGTIPTLICNSNNVFGVSGKLSDGIVVYVNPFCNPDTTDIAEWSNTCSSYSQTVSDAEFGSSSDWIIPSGLFNLSVVVPESL